MVLEMFWRNGLIQVGHWDYFANFFEIFGESTIVYLQNLEKSSNMPTEFLAINKENRKALFNLP